MTENNEQTAHDGTPVLIFENADDGLPVDNQARTEALNVLQSYCVTAPAGSGKTELLTQRFLKLLSVVDQPEHILALTFTRKAAAEMRARIVDALKLGKNLNPPIEGHKRQTHTLALQALQRSETLQWDLLENPLRLRIQTFDSFYQSIVREKPTFSGLGNTLKPTDDASALYDEAIDAFLQELESDNDASKAITELLYYFDSNVALLKKLFIQMLPFRDQWLGHASVFHSRDDSQLKLAEVLKKWIEQALRKAELTLKPYASDIALAADFAANNIISEGISVKNNPIARLAGLQSAPHPTQEYAEQWQGLFHLLLTAERTPRKSFTKAIGFPPKSENKDKDFSARNQLEKDKMKEICALIAADKEGLDALQTAVTMPLFGYGSQDVELLEPLTYALIRLCAHLNIIFSQRQQCDHNEISSAALRALKQTNKNDLGDSDQDLFESEYVDSYELTNRIHHLLVDEFQDTSVPQFELLEALTEEWPQHNRLGDDHPKTLFIVGDGMQSIYSFRAAKVGLFFRAQLEGIGNLVLQPLLLQQNFRSDKTIVDWVNTHFEAAFPRRVDVNRGAVPYEKSMAFHKAIQEQASLEVPSKSIKTIAFVGALDRSAEAAEVIQQIEIHQKSKPDDSIAILVRARSHLTDILEALDKQSIAWQGIDIDPLIERESIMDCMTFVRALLNPADDLAWFSLLRAPFCGLLLTDLHALRELSKALLPESPFSVFLLNDLPDDLYGFSQLDSLNEGSRHRFNTFRLRLKMIWEERSKKPLRPWLEGGWHLLGGGLTATHAFSGDESSTTLTFFDLLEQIDQQSIAGGMPLSLDLLENKVRRLFAKSGSSTVLHAEQDLIKPVQIMTIHKAKGLEFDFVVLPALDKKTPPSDTPLLISNEYLFEDGSTGLVMYPQVKRHMLNAENSKKPNNIFQHLRNEKNKTLEFEATRLLYVAATRARSKLCLLANVGKNPKGEIKQPAKGSLLEKLWSSLEETIEWVECSDIIESEEEAKNAFILLKRLNDQAFERVVNAQKRVATSITVNISDNDSNTENENDSLTNTSSHTVKEDYIDKNAIGIGICAHEIFQQIANEDLEEWQGLDISTLQRHWKNRLFDLGVKLDALDSTVAVVVKAVDTALKSQQGCWVLSSTHTHRHNEWPLSSATINTAVENGQSSNVLVNKFAVDRAFVDSDQVRWIIDYKMVEPEPEQMVETFLQEEAIKYKEQLLHYKTLVEAMDYASAIKVTATRMALYFPLIDKLQMIEI